VIDGWELGRRLHDNPLFDHPRLVAVSGFGSLEDRLRSLAAGFEHHLLKPVKLAELRAVLESGSAVHVP
jgi:CheY-like chemotaxis protein